METGKTKEEVAGAKVGIAEGTQEMRYWEFRKKFCKDQGWNLRRTGPQTYDVIDDEGEKVGIFKSGEGYFPNA